MTEAKWLACADPEKMLLAIRDVVSERKMRLFAIACCRRIWDRITDPRSRAAVEFAEQHVEVNVVRRRERPAVEKAAREACQEADEARQRSRNQPDHITRMIDSGACHAALTTLGSGGWFTADEASRYSSYVIEWQWARDNGGDPFVWDPTSREVAFRQQLPLLHDIFANPFRPPPPLSPAVLAWNDGTVRKLAQAIYDEGTFDRLPVLADALEDAGCADAALVAHCRGPGPHVRGCWAVDVILGKQ
jgi:hypothetical protein